MGKRSEFARRPQDAYYTPEAGVLPLLPFLSEYTKFAEPCAGVGKLIHHLECYGHICTEASDIEPKGKGWGWVNITKLDSREFKPNVLTKMIITNPPWSRPILHELIEYFPTLLPTWLLFDADWPHTRQSKELILTCSKIVSIGRLKWIEGSKSVGKDNCCWYFFPGGHTTGPHFYGRT